MTAAPQQESVPDLVAWRKAAHALQAEIGTVVLGQKRAIKFLTIAVFARGHVLLEGDVGTGKTTLLRAFARAIGGAFERVEGTIDLMPGDLLYHTYLAADGRPRVEPGPVLRGGEELSIFFFNEINRARPQVHALLLRLMAERSLSAFDRDYHFPFLQVFADRNRVEREETFELPAAARDRFFMEIGIEAPADRETRRRLIFETRFHDADALVGSVRPDVVDYRALDEVARAIQEHVRASPVIEDYVVSLWQAIGDPLSFGIELADVDMERLIQGGGSPRGLSFLVRAARVRAWLEGRDLLLPEDVRDVFVETMAHRIFLDSIYELRREALVAELCRRVFETVASP
ncbi:AAA family ATPase [Methylocella silvestris]|uniref:AAA family ATPase n=1 Tax=Methylocella silvestris TaxID=199596 RepID=UPI0015E1030B|nr:MoxR family ATPase [Methylocella silvestris]